MARNLQQRLRRVEQRIAASFNDPVAYATMFVEFLLLADLTGGGLHPDDPSDTIEARFNTLLEQWPDAEQNREAILAKAEALYEHGVEEVGWVVRPMSGHGEQGAT